MNDEGTGAVDPHQLLKALSPLLGAEGEIKGPAEMDRVMSLMKDAKKLVSRCTYINILKATTNGDVLQRFMGRSGWEVLYTWLKDAKADENTPFLLELLKVYNNIPVTVDILKLNNTPKAVKSLSKSEDERIKGLAATIVDKWMKTVMSKPSDSAASDKKKSKHRERHHHNRSSSHKDSPGKDTGSSSSSKRRHSSDSSSSKDKSEADSAAGSKKERVSSTDSVSSDKSKKPGARGTAKAPPSMNRSTGLELETLLPPTKKKTPGVIDKEKLLAAKRTSSTKAPGAPPEKRPKPQVPALAEPTSPTEIHGKIKIIPARPKPPPQQIYDSSDFMDALSASSHAMPRRKRKVVAGKQKEPTSPTAAGKPEGKAAEGAKAEGKAAEGKAAEGKDGEGAMSPPRENGEEPMETKSSESEGSGVVLSFYKDTMETDERNGEDAEMKEDENKENDDDSTSKTSETTETSDSGKKKKKVSWAEEASLTSVFYFELDENERVNVNRQKAFEDTRKQEALMERRQLEANKRLAAAGIWAWRRPPPISDLAEPTSAPGANSTERATQRQREQSVLQALYFSPEMIPDTAKEPDAETVELTDPKVIPLQDKTGGGETFVDHSQTPLPKANNALLAAPQAAPPQFSLPPEIANMIGNMAQEFSGQQQRPVKTPLMPTPNMPPVSQPPPGSPFNVNIQQILNNILEQNPAASGDEDMKAQILRMMESGPIRDQIQAWAAGQNMGQNMGQNLNWSVPPPNLSQPPPAAAAAPRNGLLTPPGPPPPGPPPPPPRPPQGGLLPPPGPRLMPPHGPPPGFHGPPPDMPWGNGPPPPPRGPPMMRGPPPPRMPDGDRGRGRSWGRGRGRGGGGGGGGVRREVCQHFLAKKCAFNEKCKYLHPGFNGPPL